MRALFDTNVVLDVMLDREPFARMSSQALTMVEQGRVSGLLGATTVTTLHYLASKVLGKVRASSEIGKLLRLFDVASVTRPVLEAALALDFADFEDAVLHEAARHADAQAIVTRDPEGFEHATLPVYSPEELVNVLRVTGDGKPPA